MHALNYPLLQITEVTNRQVTKEITRIKPMETVPEATEYSAEIHEGKNYQEELQDVID